MAFRVKNGEGLGHALRRIVRGELKRASNCLEQHSSVRVHQARKSLKKVRAILALVGDDVDADEKAVRRLKKVGRWLSAIRDAEVMIESERRLAAAARDTERAFAWRGLHSRLVSDRRRALSEANRDRVHERARRALKKIRRRAKRWHWDDVKASTFAAGVRKADEKSRAAMTAAARTKAGGDFHTWRKRSKILWYAERLLEERAPVLGERIADRDQLDTLLGEAHNLVALRQSAAARSRIPRDVPADVLEDIEQERQRLETEALQLGEKLVRATPSQLAKEVRLALKKPERLALPRRGDDVALRAVPPRHRAA